MFKILLGTSNESKIKEYKDILSSPKFSLFEFEVAPTLEVEEPFETFKENAEHKAITYSTRYQQNVIAEDSGLVIHDLNLPGVYSARFSQYVLGNDGVKSLMDLRGYKNISQLNREIIFNLCKLLPSNIFCSYIVVIALANKQGEILETFEGECMGSIAKEIVGDNGFGYDPIFVPLFDREHTLGEISSSIKNKNSHRAKACSKLGHWLEFNKDKLK